MFPHVQMTPNVTISWQLTTFDSPVRAMCQANARWNAAIVFESDGCFWHIRRMFTNIENNKETQAQRKVCEDPYHLHRAVYNLCNQSHATLPKQATSLTAQLFFVADLRSSLFFAFPLSFLVHRPGFRPSRNHRRVCPSLNCLTRLTYQELA